MDRCLHVDVVVLAVIVADIKNVGVVGRSSDWVVDSSR